MKIKSCLALLVMVTLAACTEEEFMLTTDDAGSVENEAIIGTYFDDVDDMAGLAMAADEATLNGKTKASGRKITIADSRFDCDGVVVEISTDSTSDHPKGQITIDFGDGCTAARGNVRKGIIVITYDGRRFMPGAIITITFDGYSINDVALEGVRTITNKSESTLDNPVFNIQLDGGKATWPDGTSITREVNLTRKWIRDENPLEDSWEIAGAAAGTNRAGTEYSMQITDTLVYKRSCANADKIRIPVQGTKLLLFGDRQLLIDYGDGECDRKVTVTVDGKVTDRTLGG